MSALLAGNAVAVHDIESSIYGTSLGVSGSGEATAGGHGLHMRAINQVRAARVDRRSGSSGIITGGIMHACVVHGVPFVLTGSIRDDGPLPDVITDAIAGQEAMKRHTTRATMAILIATALHAIATGNMLPGVRHEPRRVAPRAADDLRRFVGVRREQAQRPGDAPGVWRRDECAGLHAHPPAVRRARARRPRAQRIVRGGGVRPGAGTVSALGVPGSPDTGQRFLRSIAERLGADRMVEVHLLPPMRQGRVESAVAVVAVADDPASPSAAATEAPGEGPRHTIYTATYRYTRKGPDRGAWAVDVVAQADAPLDALPAVMRGVQRRSDGLCADLQVATGDAWPTRIG